MNASKQSVAKPAAQRGPVAAPASVSPLAMGSRVGNQNLHSLLRARVLQAKMTVSDPHDPYELEADSVADRVMRMSDPAQTVAHSPLQIQRACSKCDEEMMRQPLEEELQRSQSSAGNVPVVDDALEQSIGGLSGRGSSLPDSVRAFMEPRFNADFSKVRVHTDTHAHGLARAVNAQAFTVGSNVVFGAGHYAPHTDSGKRLLAHELTHVVQQGAAGTIARRPDGGASPKVIATMAYEEAFLELKGYLGKGGYSDSMAAIDAIQDTLRMPFTAQNAAMRLRMLTAACSLLDQGDAATVLKALHSPANDRQKQLRERFGRLDSSVRQSLIGILRERSFAAAAAPKADLREPPRAEARFVAKATWVELQDGVFAYVPDAATTLDKVAAYLSGHSQVPEELAKLNRLSPTAPIAPSQPVIVPIEFIHRPETIAQIPDNVRASIASRNRARIENAKVRGLIKVDRGYTIGVIPVTTHVIEQVGHALAGLGAAALYVIGFIVGVIHGFLKSIWDAISGIAKLIYSVLKSILTLEFISDIKKLASSIKNLTWEGITDAVGAWAAGWSKKLESPDSFTRGEAHGYLTGYVMAEAAMMLLSFGTIAALKGALWASKLGQLAKGSRAIKTMEATLAKAAKAADVAGSGFGKGVEALRESRLGGAVKAAEVAGAGLAWTAARVTTVLRLPATIAHYVAGKIVANLKILEPLFPKIQVLSERAKRWLFGCNSPCEWEAEIVAAKLRALDASEIEVLAAKPRVKDVEPPASAKESPLADVPEAKSKKSRKPAKAETAEPGGGDTVPATTLREGLRTQLKKDLEEVEARIADAHRAKGDVAREMEEVAATLRQDRAQPALDAAQLKALKARHQQLIEQRKELGSDADLGVEWLEIRRRIKGTERDYFESLTGAASKRDEYSAIKARKVDEVFGTVGGRMEVEHVYPRSKIFNTPGFEKLHWKDQIEVFNYEPNLRLMSAEINLARSNIEYARWSRSVWSRFPQITEEAVKKMAALEAKMKKKIEDMINDPSLIPRRGTL